MYTFFHFPYTFIFITILWHLSKVEEMFTFFFIFLIHLFLLQYYGICLKLRKCSFLHESVEYLSHHINAEGFLHIISRKVQVAKLAPTPDDQAQLRSSLGRVYYYGKHIPKLSSVLHPLNNLLQDCQKQSRMSECSDGFQRAKDC